MEIPFDKFSAVFKKIGAKVTSTVSCPIQKNQMCLSNFNCCSKGKENDCSQYVSFTVKNAYYFIEVKFYGENRKGFIESTQPSVQNFVIKNKVDLEC